MRRDSQQPSTRLRLAGAFVMAAVASSALPSGCVPGGEKESPGEVRAVFRDRLPGSSADAAWRGAPMHHAALIPQDLVDPRLMRPSTLKMRVQAVTDGSQIVFRLGWDDPTKDDLPGSGRFADACALQFPLKPGADAPAPQMGETGGPVEISYWSAFWQAAADGSRKRIRDVYPGAVVDHYPFEAASLKPGSPEQRAMAERYAPAHASGNRMAFPGAPVQDLTAEGPGTLRPASEKLTTGGGRRSDGGWSVYFRRPLPGKIVPGESTRLALAVWQGANQEVGSRKMRSGWIPLRVDGRR